jgi:hypothetical protein
MKGEITCLAPKTGTVCAPTSELPLLGDLSLRSLDRLLAAFVFKDKSLIARAHKNGVPVRQLFYCLVNLPFVRDFCLLNGLSVRFVVHMR